MSEIEQLKARLAAAEQRTQQLSAQLQQAEAQPPAVKMETIEPEIPSPVFRPSPLHTNKSGAGLGLMVSTFAPLFLFGNFRPNSIYSWGPHLLLGSRLHLPCHPSVSASLTPVSNPRFFSVPSPPFCPSPLNPTFPRALRSPSPIIP